MGIDSNQRKSRAGGTCAHYDGDGVYIYGEADGSGALACSQYDQMNKRTLRCRAIVVGWSSGQSPRDSLSLAGRWKKSTVHTDSGAPHVSTPVGDSQHLALGDDLMGERAAIKSPHIKEARGATARRR